MRLRPAVKASRKVDGLVGTKNVEASIFFVDDLSDRRPSELGPILSDWFVFH